MSRTQKLKGLSAASLRLKTLNDNSYLGNIYGLSTCPLRKWEESKSRNLEAYRTLLKQYRGMISSNAKAAAQVIRKETQQDIKQRHRGR